MSALVGEWSKSRVSTIDFVNPSTGAHADPSGERLNVRFLPDGTYKLGGFSNRRFTSVLPGYSGTRSAGTR